MQFRRWDTTDCFELNKLECEIFRDPWSVYAIYDAINCEVFKGYIMYDESGIVGYYGFYSIPPEAHIANVAIVKNKRGLGLGKELMEHLLSAASALGNTDFTLEVRPSNEVALNMYKSLGFSQEGLRRKYYGDGEDAVIMWKRT